MSSTTVIPVRYLKLVEVATEQAIALAPKVFMASGFHVTMLNVIKRDGMHLVDVSKTKGIDHDIVIKNAQNFCQDALAVILITEQWERLINVEDEKVLREMQRTGVIPKEILESAPVSESLIVQVERVDNPHIRRVSWEISRDKEGHPSLGPQQEKTVDVTRQSKMIFLPRTWN